MNIRRLQGLALIVSAMCLLIGLFGPQTTMFYLTTSVILFMLGIPSIHSVQPIGWMGLMGIVLLELAALIALGFRFNMVMPSPFADSLSFTSGLAGMLGAVIVGLLTTRKHIFPAWVGWVFMAQGVLNFITGPFKFNSLAGVLVVFLPILQVAALFAYGYFIYQHSVKPTIAGESQVPLA
jgi:hypothetical protein